MTLARTVVPRFARLATNAVVWNPRLWRIFRAPLRASFDALAPQWHTVVSPEGLAPLEAALATVDDAYRVLDLGTGTGLAAFVTARRFPAAEVVGVDLAEAMVERARANTPPELAARVRFERADGARLPFSDGSFELVTLANMIPFFDELARVVAPGGFVVFSFSGGSETPIYVDSSRLRADLGRRGFTHFADVEAGRGTAFLSRKAETG
jgi:SAM-dependent methyltransferase